MSNYNIEIDLLKLKGARVADAEGEHGVFVPINNRIGTVSDAFQVTGQISHTMVWQKRQGVILKVTALGMASGDRGQSHLIKPHISKDVFERLTEAQLKKMPWIGNMRPWTTGKGGDAK